MIEYPNVRQSLAYQTDLPLVIQIHAEDDLGVAKVEVYIDDRLVATLTQAPYLLPWDLQEASLKCDCI
jgi:hypothetical protein